MLLFLLSILIILLTSYSYGNILNNLILKKNNINFDFGEFIILGFYFLLILSITLHFIFPINSILTTLILVIGLFFLIFRYHQFNFFISYTFIMILGISFIGLISYRAHPDFEWYHLPYLNYLKDYKIIFGVSNLNDFLGYSQSWNDIVAIFRLPIIDYKVASLVPVLFVLAIIYSLFNLVNTSKNSSIKIFIYLILIFTISKYYKFNEFGGHVPPILLGFLINVYFYIFMIDETQNKKNLIFKIFFFSSLLLLLRINYLFISPIILYFLLFYYKLVYEVLISKKIASFLFFCMIIFFIKNLIISGCFYYPIDFTCFNANQLNWTTGPEFAKERFELVKALARGWSSYILLEGGISSRLDYFAVLKSGVIFSPSEYLDNFKNTWFKYWIYTGDSKKILNNFLIIIFCLLFLLPKSNFLQITKIKAHILKRYLVLLIIFLLQLLLCYFLTPQTIYGADVATIVFASFLASFLLHKINFNFFLPNFSIILLFLISISYFSYKNVNRLYNEFQQDQISFSQPWIKIPNLQKHIDYYQYSINNFKLNIRKKEQNRHQGLPDYCANIPMLCIPEDRKVCIKSINQKFNYIFITGNQKNCLNHLRKRYFY